MDRFTEWKDGHGSGLPGKDCYTQLARYEDLGLTPEQLIEVDELYTEKCQELASIREKLFELMLWTDKTTVDLRRLLPDEEYQKCRAKHYENMKFVTSAGLSEEYYDYFFKHCVKPSLEEHGRNREENK